MKNNYYRISIVSLIYFFFSNIILNMTDRISEFRRKNMHTQRLKGAHTNKQKMNFKVY
jgi:hypothetical protein